MLRGLSIPLAALLLSGSAGAQEPGSRLPEVKLRDFTQTEASSFDDFYGRAVLLEFFAHW